MAVKKEKAVQVEDFDAVPPFEPDYEDIKTRPNDVYFKYLVNIRRLTYNLSRAKNFDRDELDQQAYVYFLQLCECYDPYYMGHFFPFDRYVFKNLIIKLRAFIQRYYYNGKSEKPSSFCEFHLQKVTVNDVRDADDRLYVDGVYSRLDTDRQRQVIELVVEGYKQNEIGKRLDLSQSRVSTLKRQAIERLSDVLDTRHTAEEKNEMQIAKLKKLICG